MNKRIQDKINEALSLSTPQERLTAFLAIDSKEFYGMPGVTELRARQERVRRTIGRLTQPTQKSETRKPQSQWFCTRNMYDKERRAARLAERAPSRIPAAHRADYIRAERTGDIEVARVVAKRFHLVHGRQYSSKHMDGWNHGGRQEREENIYSKRYGHPARWINPGVRLDYSRKLIVIESARGALTEVPMPPRECFRTRKIPCGVMVGVDLLATKIGRSMGGDVWQGWELVDTLYWRKSGLAIAWSNGDVEHGASRAAIKRERAHKRQVEAEAQRKAEIEQEQRRRIVKLTRRIARMCPNLVVTWDDARAAGNCVRGIDGFINRAGLGKDERQVTAAFLWRFVGTDFESQRILNTIHQAALRVARQVIEKGGSK